MSSETSSSSSQRGIQWVVIGIAILTPLIMIMAMFTPVHSEQLLGDVAYAKEVTVESFDDSGDPVVIDVSYETEGRGAVQKSFEIPKKYAKLGDFTNGEKVKVKYLPEDPSQASLVTGANFNFSRVLVVLTALVVVGGIGWYMTRANY